MEFPVVTIQCK